MTRFRHRRHARRGFTLVELMVATALVVLILTILAVAFGAATESLSRLRSMGNMATDLRGAQDKLRADLEAEHFDSGDSPGVLRLADLKYNLLPGDTSVRTPRGGYFLIEHGSGSTYEGMDADNLHSTRAFPRATDLPRPNIGHAIEFTTKRLGTSADDLFTTPLTAPVNVNLRNLNTADTPLTNDQLVTKWARVRWFLANQRNVGGVDTWTLYRRVKAVALPTANPAPPPVLVSGSDLDLVSVDPRPASPTFNHTITLDQLTDPTLRAAMISPLTGTYNGDDIVLSNVTSFEVKLTWDAPAIGTPRAPRTGLPPTAFGSPIPDSLGAVANGDFPFDDLPASTVAPFVGQRVFDTGNNTATLPLRIRVTALQVKIRVFDPKTLLTRQVSFIVQP